jgi:chromosome segregation ATPase
MLCFFCNKKLTVGKSMKIGNYGLYEVDIKTHCIQCRKLFEKKNLLQNDIDNINTEMKGHLKEYRSLSKQRNELNKELVELEYKIFSIQQSNNELV